MVDLPAHPFKSCGHVIAASQHVPTSTSITLSHVCPICGRTILAWPGLANHLYTPLPLLGGKVMFPVIGLRTSPFLLHICELQSSGYGAYSLSLLLNQKISFDHQAYLTLTLAPAYLYANSEIFQFLLKFQCFLHDTV